MSYPWTDFAFVSAHWALEVVFVFKITTLCAITFRLKILLSLIVSPWRMTLFAGLWWLLLLLVWLAAFWSFGFWYFFWISCILWWQSKLTEAFAPVFALVDKYCPVALFCLIVFAKFFICWGLKFEGLASSFDSCSITHCVVPWLLKLNRKASLWNALCLLGLKLHKSHSLSILLQKSSRVILPCLVLCHKSDLDLYTLPPGLHSSSKCSNSWSGVISSRFNFYCLIFFCSSSPMCLYSLCTFTASDANR